ncbi:hypothetical protein AtEden1_Chr1g0038801 [Arabidopsis thaliana]
MELDLEMKQWIEDFDCNREPHKLLESEAIVVSASRDHSSSEKELIESLVVFEIWQCAFVKNNRVCPPFVHQILNEKQEAHRVLDKLSLRRHKHQGGKRSIFPKGISNLTLF